LGDGIVYSPAEAASILSSLRVIAVIGASRNPEKDAYRVPAYLKSVGYKIIPINPSAEEIMGEKAYPSLDGIPDDIASRIDAVDVFRPPREANSIVDQVIRFREKHGRPHVLWFQPGTHTDEATARAAEAGLKVVVGHCMMALHRSLLSR